MRRTQLRIVAGSLRGRKVYCTVHPGMRPTPQMVREALFSLLGGKLDGRHFVDLFAGTGIVGMEAASRGATHTTLVERDPKQADEIIKHIREFGIREQAHVLRADSYRWAERWVPPAEPCVVFLSPPFGDFRSKMEDFAGLVRRVREKVPPGSTVVVQAEEGFPMDEMPEPESYDKRRYGRNWLLLWEAPEDDAQPLEATN